jgi:hypothetical protein
MSGSAITSLQTEWYWALAVVFAVTMALGLRDRYPIDPRKETQYYLQWGLLMLYMEHCKAGVPEPCGTALVFVLLPYEALWDWVKAIYHTATNSLPGGCALPKGLRPQRPIEPQKTRPRMKVMPALIAIVLSLFSAITQLKANDNPQPEGPLRVPKEVAVDFVHGKTNYTIMYAVTNTANIPIPIAGYTASCQCTRVEATDDAVPPNGQIQLKATVAQKEPTVQYIILQDSATNLYQTILWIKPATK